MQMPGRKYSQANSGYRYGFNGKENDNETNTQDYGLRIYDPRIGRFLSVDPLEEEYPELTPYQFASNRPIDGIDLDGAEWTKAQLEEVLAKAQAALGTLATGSAIALRGTSNALVNANLVGVPDKLPFGTDNLDDYDNDYDKSLYLYGRILGDVAAGLQALTEITGGGAAASAGLAVSGTGVGVVAGGPTAVVGGAVVLHGIGVGVAAATDIGWALNKLTGMTGAVDAGKSAPQTPEQTTNQQTTSAQNNSPEASQSNTASQSRSGKVLGKKDGVEVKSYGSNDVHKPAHAHIKGGGKEVRIGPNGKPLKNQPELSTKQNKVVEHFKKEIRKELKKVGKANKALEKAAKTN